MSSSPPPAAEPKQQPLDDVTPNGFKPPSADDTSASDLVGSPPSAVDSPAAEAALSPEKLHTMKSLNGELLDPSAEEAATTGTGTGFKGATPSVVVPPVVKKPPSSEKIPSKEVSSAKFAAAWIEVRSCRYILGVPDSHGAVLFVALVSVLYALLTPWLLLRVAGQRTVFVWTVSILASSYFFIGAILFSVTMGFLAIFFQISDAALLSVAATHFISSNSGAAVATLLTFYAAGIFGHTIAEYVQRAESEAMLTPPSGCKSDGRQQSVGSNLKQQGSKDGLKQQFEGKRDKEGKDDLKQNSGGSKDDLKQNSRGSKDDLKQKSGGSKDDLKQNSRGSKDDLKQKSGGSKDDLMCFLFVQAALSLFVLVRMTWVILVPGSAMFLVATDNHESEVSLIVEEFSLETLFIIWPWTCFVALILQEGTIVSMNTMVYKVPGCAAALYVLSAVLSIALGEPYGLLALWPAPMAMAGLFGYILAMFPRYNHIHESLSQD